MQAFRAKGLDVEWVVTWNGYILDKIITQRSKYHLIRKHTTITYLQDGKGLPAFHTEKKKALAKGLLISNFDSTVAKPKIVEVKAVVRPKKVKIFGQRYALES